MCMTIAAMVPPWVTEGTPLLATDQRWTMTHGGVDHYADIGRKLLRLDDGWVAIGGDGLYGDAVLSALAAGATLETVPQLLSQLSLVRPTAPAIVHRRWPGLESRPEKTQVAIVNRRGVTDLRWNGEAKGTELPLQVYLPWCLPREEAVTRTREFLMDYAAFAGTEGAFVRRVARAFADVAAAAPTVSPTIEIGLGDAYLVGPSADLATATDSDIRAALRDPPPIPRDRIAALVSTLESTPVLC